ncbi:MAG: hypothetical protein AB8F95_09060 [Bacteroidia bacterium]
MNELKLFLYSFGILISISGCCGGNDDVPVDNTMIVHVFNLDKTDNLLDSDGPIIFDTIKLRSADDNEVLACLTEQSSGELAFLPIRRQQALESIETNELILELDSLSYTLNVTYNIEEIKCAGTKTRVTSYNFEGQEFEFDENLRYNTIELLVDL